MSKVIREYMDETYPALGENNLDLINSRILVRQQRKRGRKSVK